VPADYVERVDGVFDDSLMTNNEDQDGAS
jgi:hypothetical protein